MIYEVAHNIDIKRGEEQSISGEAAASSDEFAMLHTEVKKHLGWVSWAEVQSVKDIANRPPSAEGKAHIETAIMMATDTIEDVKKQARILSSRCIPDHMKTWSPMVARGFDLIQEINTKYIAPLDHIICTGELNQHSDKDLKFKLHGLQPSYEELQSVATQLKASVRSTAKAPSTSSSSVRGLG